MLIEGLAINIVRSIFLFPVFPLYFAEHEDACKAVKPFLISDRVRVTSHRQILGVLIVAGPMMPPRRPARGPTEAKAVELVP